MIFFQKKSVPEKHAQQRPLASHDIEPLLLYLMKYTRDPEQRKIEIERIVRLPMNQDQAQKLIQLYLSLESEVCRLNPDKWPAPILLRLALRREFYLDSFLFHPFLIIFLSDKEQSFVLLALLVERLVEALPLDDQKLNKIFGEIGRDTFLEPVRVQNRVPEWTGSLEAFGRTAAPDWRETLIEIFSKLINRLYWELSLTRGSGEVGTIIEDVFFALTKEFEFLRPETLFTKVLPKGLAKERRIELLGEEELRATLAIKSHELEEANQLLQQASRELQTCSDALVDVKKKQEDFVRVVSHQFRTPLSIIRWSAEFIEALAEMLPEEQRERGKQLSDNIRDRVSFLVMTLDNVFDLIAIESNRLSPNKRIMPLLEILSDAVRVQRKVVERKRLTLLFDREASAQDAAFIDPDLLRKVADVLLMNAINYTNAGGTITVTLTLQEYDKKPYLLTRIQDTGIGIPPDEIDRIFTRFFRGREAVRAVADGAGIGLLIAKYIAEAHDGKLWAESDGIGKGSAFSFTVPVAQS